MYAATATQRVPSPNPFPVLTSLVCVKQYAVEQCYSYEFYLEPGLGSPRCKLYGGLVAYEVSSIDPFQPYQWYDLACGDPTKFR